MSTATEKKTPVEPPVPPEITSEQAPYVEKFISGLFDGKKEKPAKARGEDAPEPKLDAEGNVIEEEIAADAPPAKPAKKPAAKNPEPAPASAAPDYDKIAEATARGMAKALKEDKPAPPAKEEPVKLDFLSEDEQAELPVLEQMEKANPTRYKGLAKKFTDAIKARQEYEAAWLKENPGKEFDSEADEHNDFFEKNDVDWQDGDHTRAITALAVSEATKKIEERSQAEISKLTEKEKVKEMEPLAMAEGSRNGNVLFTAVGGDFAKVISENGAVNPGAMKALFDEDATRAGIVVNAANSLHAYSAENVRLFTGISKFDENNPTHKYLSDFAVHHETQMQSLGREETKDKNGRIFATAKEYGDMNKEQRAKHWTFSARDLNDLLAADQVKAVKLAIDADEKRLNAAITKRGFKKEATTDVVNLERPVALKKEPEEEKPVGVEGGDGQLLAQRFRTPDNSKGQGVNRFVTGLLGK